MTEGGRATSCIQGAALILLLCPSFMVLAKLIEEQIERERMGRMRNDVKQAGSGALVLLSLLCDQFAERNQGMVSHFGSAANIGVFSQINRHHA